MMAAIAAGCSTENSTEEAGAAPSRHEMVERGRYLVENVAVCLACHSDVDWKNTAQPLRGKKGAGSIFPDKTVPFKLATANLTSDKETGLGSWTDEEIGRAIREGVGRDGRRLFPVMPYMNYRLMSDDDLKAVIAYLRTLPPVRNPVQLTPVPEPLTAMIPPPMPVKAPVAAPDPRNLVKRGEYLAALADCHTCHTPIDERGEFRMELSFAGGRLLDGPWGKAISANITPDASGIAHYDEKMFIETMRTGRVGGVRDMNKIMLTSCFKGMTDDDLRAIFAHLKMLQPVVHRVDNTEKPAPCKLCGNTHGYGEKNQ